MSQYHSNEEIFDTSVTVILESDSEEGGNVLSEDEVIDISSDNEEHIDQSVYSDGVEDGSESSHDYPIRSGFTLYNIYDIAVEDDVNRLVQLRDMYSPDSQPRTDEEFFYVNCMFYCICKRLHDLNQ